MYRSRYLRTVSSSMSVAKQLGMDGTGTTVATDVQVVSIFRGNHTEILALGFGTFANASRNAALHLVRRSNTLVAILDAHGKRDGILDTVTAPRGSNARLDGTKSFAVGMSRLEANVAEFFPNIGQFVLGGTKQIDALSLPSSWCTRLYFLATSPIRMSWSGSSSPPGNTRDDRVRSTTLHVGQGAIVGVLKCITAVVDNNVIVQRRHDGSHGGLANFTSVAMSVLGENLFKGIDRRRCPGRCEPRP